jgi:hypothetical protein
MQLVLLGMQKRTMGPYLAGMREINDAAAAAEKIADEAARMAEALINRGVPRDGSSSDSDSEREVLRRKDEFTPEEVRADRQTDARTERQTDRRGRTDSCHRHADGQMNGSSDGQSGADGQLSGMPRGRLMNGVMDVGWVAWLVSGSGGDNHLAGSTKWFCPIIIETNRKHSVLFGMHNKTFGPFLTAINRGPFLQWITCPLMVMQTLSPRL